MSIFFIFTQLLPICLSLRLMFFVYVCSLGQLHFALMCSRTPRVLATLEQVGLGCACFSREKNRAARNGHTDSPHSPCTTQSVWTKFWEMPTIPVSLHKHPKHFREIQTVKILKLIWMTSPAQPRVGLYSLLTKKGFIWIKYLSRHFKRKLTTHF